MVERHGWMNETGRAALAVLMLLAAVVAPLARTAEADPPQRATEVVAEEGAGQPPADEIERWWGVAGAVICAVEIRLIIRAPAIGMNPYALAAGIAGCSLAMLDLVTSQ